MNRIIMKSFVFMLLVIFLVVTASASALAQPTSQYADPSGHEMIADLLVIRPLYFGCTIVGTAFFIVTLPFTLVGGNVDVAAQNFVLNPGRATFSRPIGDHGTMALWPFKWDHPER